MVVKFMWNGIKVDGNLYKAQYGKGPWTAESGLPDGTLSIYAKDYIRFPRIDGLNIINETDIMTDYFETDRIYVEPDNPHYDEVMAAFEKQEEHFRKRFEKKYGKRGA